MENQNRQLSIEEAEADFSKVVKKADEFGSVVLFKDGKPKYKVVALEQEPDIVLTEDERIDLIAARVIKKYHKAFEELAK